MKTRKIILALLVLTLVVSVFVACGGGTETKAPDTTPATTEPAPETVDPNHEHVWALDEAASVAATCLKTGKNAYKCTVTGCTETKNEKVNKLEHVADGPATCQHKSVCTLCGKLLADITGHTYGEPVVVAATCTTDGTSTIKCTVCGNEKVTTLSHEDAHDFEETLDSTGTYVTKVCKKCGYTVTSVDFKTILKYDFETDLSCTDYINSAEGFNFIQPGTSSIKEEAGTENHYAYFSGANFVRDENMTLIKTDKYILEFDMMFDTLPTGANKSVFSFLPNWGTSAEGGTTDKMTWMWFIKVNSESQDDLKTVTPGEFVTYKNCSGDKLNTGKILEVNKWYHITMVMDWASGTNQIYIGDRGSGENLFLATASMELTDQATAEEEKDGVPAFTREEMSRMTFRFCDGGVSANFDNLHIYTAAKPLWDK